MVFQVLVIFILSSASADSLADEILEKHEACEVLLKKAGKTILDEGGDKFPGTARGDFFKCKDELDDLKRQYIKSALLGLKFYPEVFPIRLSNGTLLMLPVPPQSKSPDESTDDSCVACEGLCMVSKKCTDLMSNINENDDSSESSYFKIKYSHCMALLDSLKSKYITESKINIDVVKQNRGFSVLCKEGKVFMSLPQSLLENKSSEKASPILETMNSSGKETTSGTLDNSLDIKPVHNILPNDYISVQGDAHTSDSHTDLVDINSIAPGSKSNPVKKQPSYINSDPSNVKIHSTIKTHEDPNDNTDDKTNTPSAVGVHMALSEPDTNEEPTKAAESTSVKPRDDSDFSISDENVGKGTARVTYQVKAIAPNAQEEIIESITVATHNIQHDTDNIDRDNIMAMVPRDMDDSTTVQSPLNMFSDSNKAHHNIITATPIPEMLGDEIVQKETDCSDLLKLLNQIHEHNMFESVSFYDHQYDGCIESLNEMKEQYIRRHSVDVNRYRALFPVTLSTGFENLVLLPSKRSEPNEMSRSPCTTESEKTLQNRRNDIFSDPTSKDSYRNSNYLNRVPLENPAFISNEKFMEYFSQNPSGEMESALSRFANMLRKSGARSGNKLLVD